MPVEAEAAQAGRRQDEMRLAAGDEFEAGGEGGVEILDAGRDAPPASPSTMTGRPERNSAMARSTTVGRAVPPGSGQHASSHDTPWPVAEKPGKFGGDPFLPPYASRKLAPR